MDLGSIAIFNFIFYPIRPTSYKYFLHLLSPILILLPTSPVSVTFQRCFNRSVVPASPSNFSGREATVHLDATPTPRTPPLISLRTYFSGWPLEFRSACL